MSEEDDMLLDAARMTRAPEPDKLAALREYGHTLKKLDDLIEQATSRLNDLKTQRWDLSMKTIPDMMDEAGVDHVGIPGDSVDLVAEPFYKAVLPEEYAGEAAEWLDKHHHGDILRTVVSVEFAPGEREHAENVATLIGSYFRGRNIEQKEVDMRNTVHWKTLTAFVREQVEDGVAVPLHLFGATVGRMAKLKKRKTR